MNLDKLLFNFVWETTCSPDGHQLFINNKFIHQFLKQGLKTAPDNSSWNRGPEPNKDIKKCKLNTPSKTGINLFQAKLIINSLRGIFCQISNCRKYFETKYF